MSATYLRAETRTTQGTPTQVSPHIGNNSYRQGDAHRAGTTLAWTRQNRHYAELCHGQSEQCEAGTLKVYRLSLSLFRYFFTFGGTCSIFAVREKEPG